MRGCATAIRQTVRIPGARTDTVMLHRGPAALAAGSVHVLHIGSLVDLMKHGLAAQQPSVTADASRMPVKVPAPVEMAK